MADQNILVKITGEADLTDSQLQLRQLNDRGKELESEMQKLIAVEKLQEKALQNMGKVTADQRQKAEQNLQTTRQQIREQQKAITENNKSITSLSKSISTYNALNGAGGKLAMQIRQIREQLSAMEMAGDTSSDAFIELAVQAAKLQDQMGDTQQQIQILASDTKNLDAAMSVGSGLTGAFNVATSAAALLGGESEELQQAFLKVQAAMAILNGVQQVANTLNKDSVANVVLRTALQKIFNKSKQQETAAIVKGVAASTADATAKGAEAAATTAATGAQWSLNAAMLANPAGAILAAVVALIAGITALVMVFNSNAKAAREAKKAQEEYDKQNKATTYNLNLYQKAHEKAMTSIEKSETEQTNAAKARHASTMEMNELELDYLKKRAAQTTADMNKQITENNKLQIKANEAFKAKEKQLSQLKVGSKKYYKVLEELTEAERQMNEVYQRGAEMVKARNDARQAVIEKEQEIADETLSLQQQLSQSRINLMREGQSKEIAQINLEYKEKIKAITGNSAAEIALRKSLQAEQSKAIREIKRKYQLQEQAEELAAMKNMLAYDENNLLLKESIMEDEAAYKIAQLDKEKMSEQDYANQVEAINIQLARDKKAMWDDEAKHQAELEQKKTETAIQAAQQRAGVEYSSEVYELQRQQIEQMAQAEIDAVERSTATQEEKAIRVKAIEEKKSADLIANQQQENAEINALLQQQVQNELTARENAAIVALNDMHTSLKARKAYEQELKDIRDERLQAEIDSAKAAFDNHEITYEEYQATLLDLNRQRIDNEVADEQEKMQKMTEMAGEVLNFVSDMASEVFGAISDNIQQQLDDLDEYYTTDAEEAREDANKKYLSEKELEDKKLALKRKAAAVEKAEAAFNIAVNTATAIMRIWADVPKVDFGATTIAMTAMAAALGATQLAMVLSKPLPKYAKGRKGGAGEYAMVGERGAELMYVPEGASIVPHNKLNQPQAWGNYGVPMPAIPAQPNIDRAIMETAILHQLAFAVDYDRLGKAVADNVKIPAQKAVNVSIDRNGIFVSDGNDMHTILNHKYQGSWN